MFSIIIPTYNRIDLLEICLKAIHKACDKITVPFEVIVTDDSNNLDTYNKLKTSYQWVKYINGPQKGPAANRNNGFNHSKYEWLIYIDDDCIPSVNIFKEYLECVNSNPTILVFEGKIIADRNQERFDEVAPINEFGGKLWTCNLMVNREVMIATGGFDERFPFAAMEDVDFSLKIKNTYKVYFVNNAYVVHPWRLIKGTEYLYKHFISHKIFNQKYTVKNKLKFRLVRFKILLFSMLFDLKSLLRYRFKGLGYYFKKIYLNLLLIFSV